jgi:thiol-disulfide isomerase/thioredoxin
MKILSLIVLLASLACAQKEAVDYNAKLDALFQDIRMEIAKNQKNLSKQLKAGLSGVKKLEVFIQKNKIEDFETLKRWLDLYFATSQYVLDDMTERNAFIQKTITSNAIPSAHRAALADAANNYIAQDQIEREYAAKYEIGKVFPALPAATKDMQGNAISINDYKGKIVLVDFWAMWCGPCLSELPNLKEAYAKYKSKGFDILGISFDRNDRPKLERFLKNKEMTWRQIYDGKGWQSKLSDHYGIKSIPMTFILKDGVIVAKNLRGPQLMNKLSELLD